MQTIPDSRAVKTVIRRLRDLHIETERDRDLGAELRNLLEVGEDGGLLPVPTRFTAEMETRGIALIEASGGGKTTAVKRVLSGLPGLATDPGTGCPRYIMVPVESPATQKSLGIAILRQLGIEHVAARTAAWEIWNVVRQRLKATGTVVLWIDEAHDLFLSGSSREIDDMLKMLKALMQGEAAVIVILSGTERLSGITSYDPQVNRRFAKIIPRDLTVGGDSKDIEGLVREYCRRAGLRLDPAGNLIGRLIHGGRGRFGRIVDTTIAAIERALLDGDKALGLAHLAEVWGTQEGCAWEENVFVADDWAALDLDAGAREFEAARTRRQTKLMSKG